MNAGNWWSRYSSLKYRISTQSALLDQRLKECAHTPTRQAKKNVTVSRRVYRDLLRQMIQHMSRFEDAFLQHMKEPF